jgi:protease-4
MASLGGVESVFGKLLRALGRVPMKIKAWLLDERDAPVQQTGASLDSAVVHLMLNRLLDDRRRERRWTIFRRCFTTASLLLALGYYVTVGANALGLQVNPTPTGGFLGVVRIEGNIGRGQLASSEKVVPALREAFEDPNVKAVVLSIDSGGGAPLEAERINYALGTLKAKHNKPVYAVIENIGASAAYMIAMHTDTVYAGRYSLVGSVGAVLSSWDLHKAINKYDIYQQVYASGSLKAMLNPFVAPTDAANSKAQELVNKAGAVFMSELQAARKNKLKQDVQYDTGEVWDGGQAQQIGLVDQIATLEQIADMNKAEVKEFGPGKKTLTPFAASASEQLAAWVSGVLSAAAIQTLHQENSQPRLQ